MDSAHFNFGRNDIISDPAEQILSLDNGRKNTGRYPLFVGSRARLNSGPQNWKQYTASLLLFNTVLFVFGFVVLWLQP